MNVNVKEILLWLNRFYFERKLFEEEFVSLSLLIDKMKMKMKKMRNHQEIRSQHRWFILKRKRN